MECLKNGCTFKRGKGSLCAFHGSLGNLASLKCKAKKRNNLDDVKKINTLYADVRAQFNALKHAKTDDPATPEKHATKRKHDPTEITKVVKKMSYNSKTLVFSKTITTTTMKKSIRPCEA